MATSSSCPNSRFAFSLHGAATRTLITRDDLRRELWPEDTFVDFEHSLNAAIKRLRESLGDSATTPRFIETLPRGLSVHRELDAEDIAPAQAKRWLADGDSGANAIRDVDRSTIAVVDVWCVRRGDYRGGPARLGRFDHHFAQTAPLTYQLTSTSGLNIDPALSPTGASSRMRPIAECGGWISGFRRSRRDPLRLTNDAADEAEPHFLRTVRNRLFAARMGLYVIGALEVPLAWSCVRDGREPALLADGRWIAYWTVSGVRYCRGIPARSAASSLFRRCGCPVSSSRLSRALATRSGRRRRTHLFLGRKRDEKRFDWYLTGATDRLIRQAPFPQSRRPNSAPVRRFQERGVRRERRLFGQRDRQSNVWRSHLSRDRRVSAAPRRLTFGTGSSGAPPRHLPGESRSRASPRTWGVAVPVDARTGVATGALERVTDSAASDRLRNVSADGKTCFHLVADQAGRSLAEGSRIRQERQLTHAAPKTPR